jgi:DNA-binding IclR family transcriptional regulator
MSKDYGRYNRSVERAVGLLVSVCQSKRPLGLTEISRDAGLDKATTLRLLSSLKKLNFLQQEAETRRYSRGAGIFSLWPDEVSRLTRPHLDKLTAVTGETSCLIMESGVTHRICVDAVIPTRELRVVAQVGKTQPIYGGASGMVLLAYRARDEVEQFLNDIELKAFTDKALIDKSKYLQMLTTIRSQGLAILRSAVEKGTNAIAAPIVDSRGNVVAAIVLRGPDVRMSVAVMKQMKPHVLKACAEASKDLAYISPSVNSE